MAKLRAKPVKWYDQRFAALGLAIIAWALAYYFLLRALDTARNLDYLALFVLAIYGLNRLVRFISSFRKATK